MSSVNPAEQSSVNPAGQSSVNPAEILPASSASSATSLPSKSSQIDKLTEQLNKLVSQYEAAAHEYSSAQSGLENAIWRDKTKKAKAVKAAGELHSLNSRIKFLGEKINKLQT